MLYGKVVNFNLDFEKVVEKINHLNECKFKNKNTYVLDTILVTKSRGQSCNAYIIY
jgi:hypothetical protein